MASTSERLVEQESWRVERRALIRRAVKPVIILGLGTVAALGLHNLGSDRLEDASNNLDKMSVISEEVGDVSAPEVQQHFPEQVSTYNELGDDFIDATADWSTYNEWALGVLVLSAMPAFAFAYRAGS